MKITQFSTQYIKEMAELFIRAFPEKDHEWDLPTAIKYLEQDFLNYPDLCLMALTDSDEVMGAVFCSISPYYKSEILYVDSLQVMENYRNLGVAKALLAEVFRRAKDRGLLGAQFLADEGLEFPKGWYEKLGFERTRWVEYEADFSRIKTELLD